MDHVGRRSIGSQIIGERFAAAGVYVLGRCLPGAGEIPCALTVACQRHGGIKAHWSRRAGAAAAVTRPGMPARDWFPKLLRPDAAWTAPRVRSAGRDRAWAGPMAADLRQVAAASHGAPAAVPRTGLIDEQQPAVFRRAYPDPRRQRAAEQVNRVTRECGRHLADGDRRFRGDRASGVKERDYRLTGGGGVDGPALRAGDRFVCDQRVRCAPDGPAQLAGPCQVGACGCDAVQVEHYAEPAGKRRAIVQQLEPGQRPVPAGMAEIQAGPPGLEPSGLGSGQPGQPGSAKGSSGSFWWLCLRAHH
jgi:hypothetical protein